MSPKDIVQLLMIENSLSLAAIVTSLVSEKLFQGKRSQKILLALSKYRKFQTERNSIFMSRPKENGYTT